MLNCVEIELKDRHHVSPDLPHTKAPVPTEDDRELSITLRINNFLLPHKPTSSPLPEIPATRHNPEPYKSSSVNPITLIKGQIKLFGAPRQ